MPADPGLTWPSPAAISYGTALGTAQLNATAGVPGTFAYSPAGGTCLPVGSHALSVTFTPSDATKYQSARATVSLVVNKATPAVTWATPAPIAFGTALGAAQLNAAASVDGVFTYSPGAGSVPAAGSQTLSVMFTPTDVTDYQAISATVSLTVNKLTPVVYWPAPASVASGTPLTTMQLDAMAPGVAGTFTYSPPMGSILTAGPQKLTATFIPSDSKDYESVTASQLLSVRDTTAPVIAMQPQDQLAALGQSATFSVAAAGQGPLSYQWLRNSVPIPGATSPTFITAPAQIADDGSTFRVIVSDPNQSTMSTGARLAVIAPAQDSYYVATNGRDSGDGSASSPFATLQRAQQAMQTSTTKVTQVEGGTYYLAAPLILTEADAGETWEAAPGSTAILSGGEVVSGWTPEGNSVYSAQMNQPVSVDLTVAGIRQMPADPGFNPDEPYTSGWSVVGPNHAQAVSSTFTVDSSDLRASVKPGALVQVIDHLRYSDFFTRVLSVDPANGTITVAAKFDTGTLLGRAGSWRVLGDPTDLSSSGQFGYDAASSTVYLMSPAGVDPNGEQIVAAQLGTLINLKNTNGITIRGLTFCDTTSDTIQSSGVWDDSRAAIMGQSLNNSAITGNTFRNVGRGIVLSNSDGNAILGNAFEHLGVSAINLLSDSDGNTIANNTMKSIGEINLGSYGVAINDSSHNVVDSNLIDGVGRWGIQIGPATDSDSDARNTGNVISNNVIRNSSNRTNDTGAIYGWEGTVTGYDNEDLLITGNRIENVGGLTHDISGRYDAGFAQGIYMDAHLSGVTITNNVVESGGIYGVILCGGCKGNAASNNVVILQPAPVYDRGAYGSSFATGDMNFNGVTWIDLLPSYFPEDVTMSTVVVQVAGEAFGGTSPAFNVQVDGAVIGTGAASNASRQYLFKVALAPHQVHRIGIALTNGSDSGATTTALHNLELIVNNTVVSLAAPEATGAFGAYGFAALPNDLMVSDFSVTQNIVYRNGGLSQDVFDMTAMAYPNYTDPDPGTINWNILYENVSPASDAIFGGEPLDSNSIITDPAFVDPWTGDYRIRAGSPALVAGFKPAGVPLAP